MGKKYTDEQKALAVQTIRRFGGMTTEAIRLIRNMLDNQSISKSTLHEWMKLLGHLYPASEPAETPNRTEPNSAEPEKKNSADPSGKVKHVDFEGEMERRKVKPSDATAEVMPRLMAAAEGPLDDVFENLARTYAAHALDPATVKDVKGDRAVVAAATALDKMRLLRNLPTAIVEVLPDLTELHRLLGLHGVKLADLIAKLRSRVPAIEQKTEGLLQ